MPLDGLPGSRSDTDAAVDPDLKVPLALDAWGVAVQARYAERASWSTQPAQPLPGSAPAGPATPQPARPGAAAAPVAAAAAAPAPTGKAARLLGLVQRALAWEADATREKDFLKPSLSAALGKVDAMKWGDAAALMPVIKEIYRQQQRADQKPDSVTDMFLPFLTEDQLLRAVEQALPALETPPRLKSKRGEGRRPLMSPGSTRLELRIDVFEEKDQEALVLSDLKPPELVAAILQEFQKMNCLGDSVAGYRLVKAADSSPLDDAVRLGDQVGPKTVLILEEKEIPLPEGTRRPPDGIYLHETSTGKTFRVGWLPPRWAG